MRYFIIFYYIHSNHGNIRIHSNLSINQSKYPNRKEWEAYIYSGYSFYDKKGFARITNILELNEEDYEQWVAE